MWEGISIGIGISALNGLGAWLLLRWAVTQKGALFMQIFLGGMVGRLILVGGISLILLQFTDIHRIAYVSSLMGSYVIFLIAEVVYIQYRVSKRSPN